MIVLNRSMTTRRPVPEELIRAIGRLELYPKSIRFATELFDMGERIMDSAGILPRCRLTIPTQAKLTYAADGFEVAGIAYTSYLSLYGKDEMRFATTAGSEIITRGIQREGGYEFYKRHAHDPAISIMDMTVRDLLKVATKMSPSKTGFYRVDISGNTAEMQEYDLRVR